MRKLRRKYGEQSMPITTREVSPSQKTTAVKLQRYLPALRQAGAGLGAFLAAGAPLFGGLSPLGLCIAASISPVYALCAGGGAALGYLRALPITQAAPYLVAVAAVVLFRLFAGPARYEESPFAPACAGAICFCLIKCGLLYFSAGGFSALLLSAAESLLMMGISYLLATFFASPQQALHTQDPELKASLCLAGMTALACFTPFVLFGIHLAHIAASVIVLTMAWRKGSTFAAFTGVAVLVVLCSVNPSFAYAGIGIAAGGLASGLFLPEGRGLTAMVFCGAGFLGVLCNTDASTGLFFMAELCIAAFIFTLLPARLLAPVPMLAGSPLAHAAHNTLSDKLQSLSGALDHVGITVQQIYEKLPPKTETFATLCDAVANQCCRTCNKNTICWVEHSTDTYDAFNQIAPLVHSETPLALTDLPRDLLQRCSTPAKLTSSINSVAAQQSARRGLYLRSTTTRAALCEQYSALAATLSTLAGQISHEELPDRPKTRRTEQLFRDLGLEPLDIILTHNETGQLRGSAVLSPVSFNEVELLSLAREVSALCHQQLTIQCRQSETVTMLLFEPCPTYQAVFSKCSLPAKGELSADAVQTFVTGSTAHALLCDGMGTGKAAAVDGMMTATLAGDLLKAGFSQAETARLVNVALALKCDDETATTFDSVSIDLYSGEACLYKAGGAQSFLLHGSNVSLHGITSVPIGILDRVMSDECRVTLATQDILFLVSDGVLAHGTAWVCELLCANHLEEPQALANRLAQTAREHAEHPDDITVVAIRLCHCS